MHLVQANVNNVHGKFDSPNQKPYPDLGSDMSSVWNLCACFSDKKKKRAARDIKRNNSLVMVERKHGLLWELIISLFVVRKRASSWLLELLLPHLSKVSSLGHGQKYNALNVTKLSREVGL